MYTRHVFSLSIAFLFAAALPSGVHAYNPATASGDTYSILIEHFEMRSRSIQERDDDVVRLTDALQLPRIETILICRVRERYAIAPLAITRERLVTRLANATNTDPRTVEALITNEQHCQTFAPQPHPSLFYAGAHEGETEHLQAPEASDDATPPPSHTTESPSSVSSPLQPPATTVPQDQTPPLETVSPTTPPLATMQSLLCRLQQRLRNDDTATPGVLSELAAKYAAEWNVQPNRIERALQDDDLCTSPTGTYFAGLLQGNAPTEDDDVTSSAASSKATGNTSEPVADSPSFWSTLTSLPPAVLIVAGMGLLTFFALILLLLAPLFQKHIEP